MRFAAPRYAPTPTFSTVCADVNAVDAVAMRLETSNWQPSIGVALSDRRTDWVPWIIKR